MFGVLLRYLRVFSLTCHRAHLVMLVLRLRLDQRVELHIDRVGAITRQLGDKFIHRTTHQGIDDARTGLAVAVRVGGMGGSLP